MKNFIILLTIFSILFSQSLCFADSPWIEEIKTEIMAGIQEGDAECEQKLKEYLKNGGMIPSWISEENRKLLEESATTLTKSTMLTERIDKILKKFAEYFKKKKERKVGNELALWEKREALAMGLVLHKALKGTSSYAQEYRNIAQVIREKILPPLHKKVRDANQKVMGKNPTTDDMYRGISNDLQQTIDRFEEIIRLYENAANNLDKASEILREQVTNCEDLAFLADAYKQISKLLLEEAKKAEGLSEKILKSVSPKP